MKTTSETPAGGSDPFAADPRPAIGALESAFVATLSTALALAVIAFGVLTFAVPAAVVVLAVLAFVSPAAGLVGFAALAPFDAYLPAFRMYKDLLWADMFVLAALAGALRRLPRFDFRSLEHALACLALGALAILQLVSLTFAADWADGLDNVLRYGYFVCVVLLLPGAAGAGAVRLAAIAFVCATVGRFAIEAVPYFGRPDFVLHPTYQFGSRTSNPNTLAGLASPALPLALAVMVSARSRPVRLALVAAAGLIAAGVIVSFSKGSWLAALAGVTIWGVLDRRHLPRRALVAAALLAVAAAALLPAARRVPELMIARWTSPASAISNQARLKYMGVGFELAREHPLLGVGLEQFPRAYRERTGDALGPDDPHNAYLLLASELGLPALTMFLVFLGALWAGSLRAWQRGQRPAAGLAGAFTALAVVMIFSAEPWNSRVFWMLAALPWPLLDPDRKAVSAL